MWLLIIPYLVVGWLLAPINARMAIDLDYSDDPDHWCGFDTALFIFTILAWPVVFVVVGIISLTSRERKPVIGNFLKQFVSRRKTDQNLR